MGLLDQVLGGMGGSQSGGSSSMSPFVKAALLLLVTKAAQRYLHPAAAQPEPEPSQAPEADTAGQGKISSGMLAGLPSLAGLGELVEQFTKSGQGDTVNSWVGSGENKPVSSDQLQNVLGPDVVNKLQQQTGLPVDELLNGLSQVLPQVVDKLTPQGRMPTEQEASRW